MVATNRTTGEIVEPGATVTNFRGETGVFTYISRGAIPGKSGKVIVDGRETYDSVWDLKVTAMLPCGCVVDERNDCCHPVFGVVSV
jgi:hypothetical protein